MKKMKVSINDLTFKCIIGILPEERIKKQRVIINCSFYYIYKDNEFVDYSLISKDIESIMKNKKFELIEDALLFIKRQLKKHYNITKVKLTIKKPDILKNCTVAITA